MSLADKNMNFDELIRNKLENVELPYDTKGWEKLEKSLPQSKTIIPKKFIFGAASVIILVAVLTTYLYVNNKNNIKQSNNKINNIEINKKDNINTYADNDVKNTNDNMNSQQNNTGNENIAMHGVYENAKRNTETRQITPVVSTQSYSNNNWNNIVENNNPVAIVNPNNTANILRNPNAGFSISSREGCSPLKVTFAPEEKNDSLLYFWNFGNGITSAQMSPSYIYNDAGNYNVTLTIKYPKTKRTSTSGLAVVVKASPNAEFTWAVNDGKYSFSPNNRNSDKYIWNFGDAGNSDELYPEHQFVTNGSYNVQLTVTNGNGCSVNSLKKVDVKIKLFRMANAFSPNGDGLNDKIGPEGNLSNYEFRMRIFDSRTGNKVFETTDFTKKWDGIIQNNGQKAAPGLYVWEVILKDQNGNINPPERGTITLLP
ncbi:MAG: PKD domain-containing protein [Bacteroidales bacterium]